MFSFACKTPLFTLLTILLLSTVNSSLAAWDDCCYLPAETRTYVGGFGGGIYSESTSMTQMGTAFFTEAEGGPLAVLAQGRTKSTSSGFGGIQLGYEMSRSDSFGLSIAPAMEIEAFWFCHKKKGNLINPTERLPEHTFADSFNMDLGVYLANAVLSFNTSCFDSLSPYVGIGIGASRISIKNATSNQIDPVELGINHFNSKRNDSSWTFAAQAKAGLRYNISGSFHVFGEYRYLFLDSSNYIFGSTVYPTHAATSPWNVKVKNIQYNAFVFGIQYDL